VCAVVLTDMYVLSVSAFLCMRLGEHAHACAHVRKRMCLRMHLCDHRCVYMMGRFVRVRARLCVWV